jgi:hypothetical protein
LGAKGVSRSRSKRAGRAPVRLAVTQLEDRCVPAGHHHTAGLLAPHLVPVAVQAQEGQSLSDFVMAKFHLAAGAMTKGPFHVEITWFDDPSGHSSTDPGRVVRDPARRGWFDVLDAHHTFNQDSPPSGWDPVVHLTGPRFTTSIDPKAVVAEVPLVAVGAPVTITKFQNSAFQAQLLASFSDPDANVDIAIGGYSAEVLWGDSPNNPESLDHEALQLGYAPPGQTPAVDLHWDHNYSQPGTYTATFMITHEGQNGSASESVTLTATFNVQARPRLQMNPLPTGVAGQAFPPSSGSLRDFAVLFVTQPISVSQIHATVDWGDTTPDQTPTITPFTDINGHVSNTIFVFVDDHVYADTGGGPGTANTYTIKLDVSVEVSGNIFELQGSTTESVANN